MIAPRLRSHDVADPLVAVSKDPLAHISDREEVHTVLSLGALPAHRHAQAVSRAARRAGAAHP